MKGLLHLKLYCETNVSRPRNKRVEDLCSLYILTSAFMKVREKKGNHGNHKLIMVLLHQ